MVIFLLLLSGCSQTRIEGLYVRHVQGAYSTGEDSLFVSASSDQLAVSRHTGYTRFKNGKPSGMQLKIQQSLFNNIGNGQWQDAKTAAVMSFGPNSLRYGAAVYDKIK